MPLGFIAACLAAGLFFVLAVIGFGPDGAFLDRYLAETLGLAAGVSAAAGAFAAIPAALGILLAEIFGWRSVFFYLLAGGATGLWAALVVAAPGAVSTDVGVEVFLATGVVAGFFYWLIAGRSAGIADPAPST